MRAHKGASGPARADIGLPVLPRLRHLRCPAHLRAARRVLAESVVATSRNAERDKLRLAQMCSRLVTSCWHGPMRCSKSKRATRVCRRTCCWYCKFNKDISFALRRGTIAQVTTHHHALDGLAATPGQRALVRTSAEDEEELLPALNRRATGRRVGIAKQSLVTMLISFFSLSLLLQAGPWLLPDTTFGWRSRPPPAAATINTKESR
jgi:hypothetical protein